MATRRLPTARAWRARTERIARLLRPCEGAHAETKLSQAEAHQFSWRIDAILERLAQAVKQTHERFIGGRQVLNEESILGLYEGHAALYLRGNVGAKVEFNSQLLLSETRSVLISD